jgi:hypothetical protein
VALAVRFMAPVVPALQSALVTAVVGVANTMAVGAVMVTTLVPVHPLASVAVTVYVPAGAVNMFAAIVPPVLVYTIVPTPPVTLNAELPIPPLQRAAVSAEASTMAAGAVMVAVAVVVQPLASVTITVYNMPAIEPARAFGSSTSAAELSQSNVNGAVPPTTVRLILPLLAPAQVAFTLVAVADSATAGSVIVTVAVLVHNFASVTVTVYGPAAKPVAVAVVAVLGDDHAYEYGAVPPAALTVAEPVESPLQSTFVLAVMAEVKTAGSVTVAVAVAVLVQLFASVAVMVTVYVPAALPVKSSDVSPLLHR